MPEATAGKEKIIYGEHYLYKNEGRNSLESFFGESLKTSSEKFWNLKKK